VVKIATDGESVLAVTETGPPLLQKPGEDNVRTWKVVPRDLPLRNLFRGSRGRVSQVAGSRRTRRVSWGHEYILGMGRPWKVESKIEKCS
jgi:hypothetical protein